MVYFVLLYHHQERQIQRNNARLNASTKVLGGWDGLGGALNQFSSPFITGYGGCLWI
jgi:hypothetical protein